MNLGYLVATFLLNDIMLLLVHFSVLSKWNVQWMSTKEHWIFSETYDCEFIWQCFIMLVVVCIMAVQKSNLVSGA